VQGAVQATSFETSAAAAGRVPAWAQALCGAVIALAGSLVARAAFDLRGLSVDDAYIHLHIARNWAEGNGPVFNPGERVEASTSPAWLSLLALQLRAGISGPTAAALLEGAATAAAGAGVALLAAAHAGVLAALLAPLVLALLPAFSIWGASGLETPLAAAVLVWSFWWAERVGSIRGAVGLGLLGALLVTVRPEAMGVGPVLILLTAWRLPAPLRWRALLAGGAAFAVPIGALLLLRHSYFGQWVPNTYIAKVAGITFGHRVRGIRYVLKFAILHLPLLAGLALLSAPQRRRLAPPLVVVGVLLAAVAYSGGDHFYYQRLAVPALVVLCLPLAIAAATATGVRRLAAAGLIAVQLPVALFVTKDRGSIVQERDATRFMEELGRALAGPPPGSLATIGIGAIAWFSRRPILDMVGLADPVIARSPRFPGAKGGHEHGDAEYVMKRSPDLVLLFTWPTPAPIDDVEELRQLSTLAACCSSAKQLIDHPDFRRRYQPFDLAVESGAHQRMWRKR
jgi:hypothetical protein